ncbi:hypothetical protein Btru_042525 [Bulinus truncatus]|nr:hypothetical protein Btru_042525 [Bulinus truncatus]
MEKDCPNLESVANSTGLTISSNSTSSGHVVEFTCTQASRRIDGLARLTCRNGTWSSELPTCTGEDELTDREIIIIASCSAALGAVLVLLLVLTICLLCARRRRTYKRSQRLQEKLQTWSMRDPLEEIVHRETKRRALRVQFLNEHSGQPCSNDFSLKNAILP